MNISANGIKFITGFEGCILQAYDDYNDRVVQPGGKVHGTLSIGIGHTSAAGPPRVYIGMAIDLQMAERILLADLQSVQLEVQHLVKVPLNQNQYDALVSFQYNTDWLAHPHCSLLIALNGGNYHLADQDFMLYDRARGVEVAGLTRRRKAEKELFMEPVSSG